MKKYHFDSQMQLGKQMDSFTQEQVQNEPMLYNCDRDFAYKHGGPITRNFLDCLDAAPVVYDSRVHQLTPGTYPALPGYHHDDVPRGADGQPDYHSPPADSRHAMGLVGGVAPTDFALGEYSLSEVPEGRSTYVHWHTEVVEQIEQGTMKLVPAEFNRIIYFDWHTMHQATRAVTSGWRWYGRAHFQIDGKPINVVRRQIQVYLENPWR